MQLPVNHSQGFPTEKVSLNIPAPVHLYFKTTVIPFGFFQSVGAEFFVRFHAACVAAGITQGWELGVDKVGKMAEVLDRMNFNAPAAPVLAQNEPQPEGKKVTKKKKGPTNG